MCICVLLQVDPKGGTILVGFDDGVVRVLVFQKKEVVDVHGRKKEVSALGKALAGGGGEI